MASSNEKLIAVIGATGQQGGGVVRALTTRGDFKVRALSRHPDQHRGLARDFLPWGRRNRRDAQFSKLIPTWFGFVRPNCARKQDRRQAADQVVGMGASEFPGDANVSEGLT